MPRDPGRHGIDVLARPPRDVGKDQLRAAEEVALDELGIGGQSRHLAALHEGVEGEAAGPGGLQPAREDEDQFLERRGARGFPVERVRILVARGREDHLGREMGHGRVGVVTVPHDQPGIPFHAERAQQALDIAFRLRGRLLVTREGIGTCPLLFGGGKGQVEGRQGIHQEHRGVPARDVVREPVHFGLGQRVGQGGQEHVQVVGVVVPGLDLHHVVLLAQLLGHGPGLPALHGVEIEPAEKPHVRGQDAELRAVRTGRHAQAADQLVLHGQPAVQETDHLFLRAAGDGDPGEDVRKPGARALKVGQLPGRDAEPFPGLPGLGRVHFRGLDAHLHPAAAHGVQLLEHVEQARTGLYVGLRHLGTHEGLDEHGTLGVQFRQHPHGLAGEGM